MERARDEHGACMGLREVDWARGTRGGTSGIAVVCVGRFGGLLKYLGRFGGVVLGRCCDIFRRGLEDFRDSGMF